MSEWLGTPLIKEIFCKGLRWKPGFQKLCKSLVPASVILNDEVLLSLWETGILISVDLQQWVPEQRSFQLCRYLQHRCSGFCTAGALIHSSGRCSAEECLHIGFLEPTFTCWVQIWGFFFSSFFFLSFRIYFSPYNNSKIGFMFQNYFFWNPQDVTIINQNENTVQIIIEIKKTPSIEAFTQFYSFQFFYRSCSSNLSKNLSQRLPLSCLPITENAVSWKKQPVVNGWL